MSTTTLIVVIAVLGAGTFAMRFAGAALGGRLQLSPAVARILPLAAVALLAALAITATFTDAGDVAGIARPAGVLAGVVAAWRRAPFVVVVLVAAATAALLRLAGIP